MQYIPAPGLGCYKSTYPSIKWIPEPCGPKFNSSVAYTVGNGSPDDFAGSGTPFTSVSGGFTSETGYQNEYDNVSGGDQFSLQLLTNTRGITWDGNPTEGLVQFTYVTYTTAGTGAGVPAIVIQYWLIGYAAPNGPGKGHCPSDYLEWSKVGSSCFIDSAYPYEYNPPQQLEPYQLASARLQGLMFTNSSGDFDQAEMCINGTCDATTSVDYFNMYGYWAGAEFNVLGLQEGSEAVFNSGVTLDGIVGTSSYHVGCSIVPSNSLETSNFNMNSCSGNVYDVQFTEAS